MNKVSLRSITTCQCYTPKKVSSNSYLISKSINNDNTSDNCSNNKYGLYVTSIENEWEYYEIKYGEEYLNSQSNRFIKQTLNWHVQKLNEIFFRMNKFEQHFVLLN